MESKDELKKIDIKNCSLPLEYIFLEKDSYKDRSNKKYF